jgi:hypothetical protein
MEMRQFLSVMLVFALLGAVLVALRKGGIASIRNGVASLGAKTLGLGRMQARTKSFESVERMALTPQHALHLVRIHGREVVIATHPRGCELLSENVERWRT